MAKAELEDFIKSRPPLFWWILVNTLAIAFAITSWVVCLNLFRDPVHPLSYKMMLKVGRLSPLENFAESSPPKAQHTFDQISLDAFANSLPASEWEQFNRSLRRAYLSNFKKEEQLAYVTGDYRILSVRKLTSEDFLSPGLLLEMQAEIRPQPDQPPVPYPVMASLILPGDPADPSLFPVQSTLRLERDPFRMALLDLSRIKVGLDSLVKVTLVPLRGIKFDSPLGPPYQIIIPEKANPGAPLPPPK